MYSKQPAPRQDKSARDEIQRSRILAAAKHCFVRHGFHGTSMSELAGEAGISVGLIYRYFKSKEDVIAALASEVAGAHHQSIVASGQSTEVVNNVLDIAFQIGQMGPEERNLILEIQAEAGRNPAIAELVRKADEQLHVAGEKNVLKAYPALTSDAAKIIVECFAVVSEGLLFRQLSSIVDQVHLRNALGVALISMVDHVRQKY